MPDAAVEGEVLYRSPKGLYDFQAEGIARWMLMRALLCTWQTGCGKSHLTLAGGAMLFEERLIDLLVVVCEQNKVREWLDDFEEFTDLRAVRYLGAPKKRAAIRETFGQPDGPQVIVTTYATSRSDLGKLTSQKINGKTRKVFAEGPLTEALRGVALGRGLAIVYDESSNLGNRWEAGYATKAGWVPERGSVAYKAHEYLLKEIRKVTSNLWVAAMTGTKVERSPENIFNQFRLLDPQRAGTVEAFRKDHVRYTDRFNRSGYKNIGPNDIHREPWVTTLADKLAPIHSFKSKTDADIRGAFPEATEEPMYVELGADHRKLYNAVESLADDPTIFPEGMDRRDEQVLFGIQRLVAAHPLALAHTAAAAKEGTLANLIVERVGYETLEKIGSAKLDALVAKLRLLVGGQGAQVIVFTFFGASVIPLLNDRLTREGFSVAQYHGGMTTKQRDDSKDAFRAGEFEILLASDAAARGLNIPEAQYVINFELCLTHAKTTQRINRVSRLNSGHSSVTAFSMIAIDTIEEVVADINFTRQEWEEYLTPEGVEPDADGDEAEFIKLLSTDDRRRVFSKARRSSKTV